MALLIFLLVVISILIAAVVILTKLACAYRSSYDERALYAENTEKYAQELAAQLNAANEELAVLKAMRDNRTFVYSDEYKAEAVRYMVEHPEESTYKVSEKIGVPASTLRRWRKESKNN